MHKPAAVSVAFCVHRYRLLRPSKSRLRVWFLGSQVFASIIAEISEKLSGSTASTFDWLDMSCCTQKRLQDFEKPFRQEA